MAWLQQLANRLHFSRALKSNATPFKVAVFTVASDHPGRCGYLQFAITEFRQATATISKFPLLRFRPVVSIQGFFLLSSMRSALGFWVLCRPKQFNKDISL
jgi:hypothetical protein